jgi:hypothetical protein
MNSSVLFIGAFILIPLAVLFWFRINAAIVFLSLCLGDVLTQFVSPDAHEFLALFSAHVAKGVDAGNDSVKILLLLLPVVLTSLFMIKTVKGNNKYLNILPAIGVGVLVALLLTPLLPAHLSATIISSKPWLHIKNNQALVVSISAIVCLGTLFIQRPKTPHEKEKHGKH